MTASKTYLSIPASGELPTVFTVAPDKELQELQNRVGGFFDQARCWGSHSVIVNDTGVLEGLPINRVATFIAGRFGTASPLVGNAVLVGALDNSGEFQSVSEAMIELAQCAAISDSVLVNPARDLVKGGAS